MKNILNILPDKAKNRPDILFDKTKNKEVKKNADTELKIVSIGKVYRRDEDDATHTHQFTQIDCFAVGKNFSFSHLKGTLESVVQKLLGKEQTIRLRPSYFPFTEPSVEIDAQIAGAGLIHPQVLKNGGFDSQKFTGFAFAFGLERLLMIKYGIEDIRHFYLNDIRSRNQQFIEIFPISSKIKVK
ncbi:29108_t:CDS:2, partial [Racocetra persica]